MCKEYFLLVICNQEFIVLDGYVVIMQSYGIDRHSDVEEEQLRVLPSYGWGVLGYAKGNSVVCHFEIQLCGAIKLTFNMLS